MILFFGTKHHTRSYQKLHNVTCLHCNQNDTLTAVSQPNYFHLFWIPLIKIGTSHYAECSHCKRLYYKEEFSTEMEKAFV